jgi:mono/diheme cytochrome c family protein
MRKLVVAAALLAVAGGLVFWFLTAPNPLPADQLAAIPAGDAVRGEQVFWAGGCASCHAKPGSKGVDKLKLVGGVELKTPFGTFVAPNISPDATDGIGAWSVSDLANAMKRGISPEGQHFYPAFPYASYARMNVGDIADLYAFLQTIPAVSGKAADNQLSFPFNFRRGLGLWKLLFLSDDPVEQIPAGNDQLARGRYLVEGPGHCGECHTPRNLAGGIDKSRWLGGAVAAEGDGKVPNITSAASEVGSWSQTEIAEYLETGLTPVFDTVGGAMVEVQENMAQLPVSDLEAIAAYLKAVPPVAGSN